MKRERLFLIDGSALAYRAYFAFIRRPLINSKGENTSAAYGFVNSLLKLLREEEPQYIALVFDTKAPTFRHQMYKEYKSTRAKMPEEMVAQLPRIRALAEALNLPILEKEGYEADDLIGTLAVQAQKAGLAAVMVTGDKDFMQLVDDHVVILNPRQTTEELELLDRAGVKEKIGVPPEKVIDFLGLMGDTSDNVPGIPGVGPKTAVELIEEFGSLEGVLKNAEKIKKEKLRENILQHKEDALLSKKLVTIDTNAPVKLDLKHLRRQPPDEAALRKLFLDLEFTSLLKILGGEGDGKKVVYRLVDDLSGLKSLVAVLKRAGEFAVDTETTNLEPLTCELVGISISKKAGEAFYIPVGHTGPDAKKNLRLDETLALFRPLLESADLKKIGQNVKYDYQVFRNHAIEMKGIACDTMLVSYLLNPTGRQHNLDALAQEHFGHKMIPISDLIGTGKKQRSFAEVPVEKACEYSAEDADFTFRLKEKLLPRLAELGLEKLFYEIELPLVPVLAEMERNGVALDVPFLKKLSIELDKRLEKLTEKIYDLAGEKFNINSTQQLGQVLFEKLKLTPGRKTTKKTALSTDIGVLEELAKEHKLPALIVEYRQYTKLKSTYIDALPALINPRTGRLHTSFNQAVAATGRLSSADPNLQNIPIRTEVGSQIRKAFIPGEKGYSILSADYSQIELRLMAHFSGDKNLIAAFERGEDVHARTASEVFGVPIDKVTSEQRRVAKTANFALMYGVTAYGLSQQSEMTLQEAKQFIETYFARYPGVRQYMDDAIAQAQEKGYAETLFGRRRSLPEINSQNAQVRGFAERNAINTPLQGTAADVIKKAMIEVHERLKGKKSKMILQVHDELVFEVPPDEVEWLKKMVTKEMEEVVKLKVPLKVDIGVGKNWLETKEG